MVSSITWQKIHEQCVGDYQIRRDYSKLCSQEENYFLKLDCQHDLIFCGTGI